MADFRIRNDVGATVFALLAGLSTLFLMAWLFNRGVDDTANPALTPIPVSAEREDLLKSDLDDANAELAAESARRAELATELRNEKSARADIEAELDALKLKLSNQGNKSERLSALRARVDNLNSKLATETAALGEANVKWEAAQNATAKATAALAAQKKTCADEKAQLHAEIETLRSEIAALKKTPNPDKKANLPKLDLPLLVNDASTLDGRFLSLFQGLNQVKGGPEQRKKVYKELTKDGKSKDIHIVPFEVGSSAVTGKAEQELKTALTTTEKSARFLVVGYASTDGDAASNRKLSSERASNVAQKIAAISGVPQDQVKAIYFGQTTRFNAEQLPPNRVVEVWRLK